MKILLSFLFAFSLALTGRSQTITTSITEVQGRFGNTQTITQTQFVKNEKDSTITQSNPVKTYQILNRKPTSEGHMIYLCKSDGNYFTIWFMPKLQAVRIKNDADAIGSTLYFNTGKRPKE